MAYNDNIAYESTLAEALNKLFGEGSVDTGDGGDSDSSDNASGNKSGKSLTQTEIVKKAQSAFDNAQKAQKDGDWAKYGEYLDELEKYLNMLGK